MLDRRVRLPYSDLAGQRAKELRKNFTTAEAMLWSAISKSAIRGYDFHRQKPIGDFIVDFFCPALMLAIEIDGGSHRYKGEYDLARQAWIEGLGVRFLRFEEMYVRRHLQDVLRGIERWIERQEAAER